MTVETFDLVTPGSGTTGDTPSIATGKGWTVTG
jgi:hypothetical protein